MKNFNQNVTKIYFILGDACNMACHYCKAQCNINKATFTKPYLNSDVLSFLKNTIESKPTVINFYGGEPLLYFDTIKEIIDSLNIPQGDVVWTTMTNGKSITPEMVEYFNNNRVTVNLSWDGHQTEILRGEDVLANRKLRETIFEINNLWVNSTLTTLSYPLEIAESYNTYLKEYQDKHGYSFNINIGLATPVKTNDPLYLYDYERIYKEVKEILFQFAFHDISAKDDSNYSPIDIIGRTLIRRLQRKALKLKDTCLSMDVSGNFFTCPFSRCVTGNLGTLDDYIDQVKRIQDVRHCKENCIVKEICDGGCPQLKGSELFKDGCKLRRAIYMPIIELVTGQLAKEKGVD